MPFGLTNAGLVYLDSPLICSSDFGSHMPLSEEVAQRFKRARLINVGKSKLCQKKIKHLEYIMGDGSVKTDPDKLKAFPKFPVLKLRSSCSDIMTG